jgi:hypothetical protein
MKRIVLTDALGQIGIPGVKTAEIRDSIFSAANIGFAGVSVPLPYMVAYAIVFGVAALALSVWVLRKRIGRQ